MAHLPAIKDIELDDLDIVFPASYGKQPRATHPQTEAVVLEYGPLTAEHVKAAVEHVESGVSLGAPIVEGNIQRIRHTHHRLAQLLAMGMSDVDAARICNYAPGHIQALRKSPAFQELEAHYAYAVKEEFTDFVEMSKDLSIDMLGRLREILEEQPEKLTPALLLEAIRTLGDRAGFAPVQKALNINVNSNMGDRLKAARERAAEAARLRLEDKT